MLGLHYRNSCCYHLRVLSVHSPYFDQMRPQMHGRLADQSLGAEKIRWLACNCTPDILRLPELG